MERSPRVVDLYRKLSPKKTEFLHAIGLGDPVVMALAIDERLDDLLAKVRDDDEFVREHRLEAVRETLTLDYPS